MMTNETKAKIADLRRQGLGYAGIGRELGIPSDTVKSFCRRNGLADISIPGYVSGASKNRCRECGRPLVQPSKQKKRKFCCKDCCRKWWATHTDKLNKKAIYSFTCAQCGQPFTAYGNKNRKFCSHDCYITHRFRGGEKDE